MNFLGNIFGSSKGSYAPCNARTMMVLQEHRGLL